MDFKRKISQGKVANNQNGIGMCATNITKKFNSTKDQGQGTDNNKNFDSWMSENNVTLHGHDIPAPIFTFGESNFPGIIQNMLCTQYEKPTPIQSISWPVALNGHDLISIAKTGSGKTLAFTLPAIVHIINQTTRNTREGPAVVILLPTRELAQQVEQVAQEYCKPMRIGIVCCYGGAPKGPQIRALKQGVDICIATPGRLQDFLDSNVTSLRRCSFLVMDEADRMLDMGFEPQIRRIVGGINSNRQTLMFSATWPQEVRKLASDFQNDPIHLTVGSLELAANHNIEQNVEVINEYRKPERLGELLAIIMQKINKKTIIFVGTKRKADELVRTVRQSGYSALCIHGDKDQRERNWVLNQFKEGKISILLATDVAARGIDVHDIKFVINYDFPKSSEDYVHRIGRTGRRDEQGTAYSFFTQNDGSKANDLVKVLEEANQNIPHELASMVSMRHGRGNSKWGNRKRSFGNGYSGAGGGQSKRTKFDNDGYYNNNNKSSWGNNNNKSSSWNRTGSNNKAEFKENSTMNNWSKNSGKGITQW